MIVARRSRKVDRSLRDRNSGHGVTRLQFVQPKYYGGEAEMIAALSEIRSQGGRFLVAGRLDRKSFHTLRDLGLPASLRDLFEEFSEAEFRCDLSSTELRSQNS